MGRVKEKEVKKLSEIIVLDIETTGLNLTNSIVEIGICILDLKKGEINPTFNLICQEKEKIIEKNAWIFENSDLSYDDVENAPDLEKFRNIIQEFFNLNYPCTAFNQKFDFGFLENRNFKILSKFWDAMILLRDIMKIPHHYYGYKFPSVQEAYDFLFGDYNCLEKHRALDDAIIESKIIYETYQRYGDKLK